MPRWPHQDVVHADGQTVVEIVLADEVDFIYNPGEIICAMVHASTGMSYFVNATNGYILPPAVPSLHHLCFTNTCSPSAKT